MRISMHIAIIWSLGCWALAGCVSPLDFPIDESVRYVVLSGVISNSPAQRDFELYLGGGLEDERTPVEASGRMMRDGEFWGELIQVEPGRFMMPPQLQLEAGRSYHAEFETADGDVFRSVPTEIPARVKTDSLSADWSTQVVGTNSFGGPKRGPVVDVYAHITLPGEEKEEYYRWEVDEAWAFREAPKPVELLEPGEPDRLQVCYLRRETSENASTLLSSEDLGAVPVRVKVASQPVDEDFAEKHYFNVYLHSITEDAFRYYENIERLEALQGNLYDEIPAGVRGNVYNAADTGELVLGYVDISLADTIRLPVSAVSLGIPINPPCYPANGGSPCFSPPPRPNDTTTYYCRCWDCDKIYGFSTLIRPDYWD